MHSADSVRHVSHPEANITAANRKEEDICENMVNVLVTLDCVQVHL